MFALRVLAALVPLGLAEPLPDHERHGLGAVAADVRTAGPFAFARRQGDRLAVGESEAPVAASDVDAWTAALAGPDGTFPPLDDALRALVLVDAAAGRAWLWSSIRCQPPCDVHLAPGRLMAGTSVASLRALGLVPEEDPDRLGEMLVYRYVAPPHTLLRGVRRLVGGRVLEVDLASGRVLRERHLVLPAPAPLADDGAVEPALPDLDAALARSVDRALAGSRRPGLLLSGGLDSTLLGVLGLRTRPDLASAASSFGFLEAADEEGAYARSVADHLRLPHHLHVGTREGYLRGLVEAVAAAEEPLHHLQSVMLHLLFADHAAGRHDLMLSGEGADGIFGNDVHARVHRYRRAIRLLSAPGGRSAYHALVSRMTGPESRWRFFDHDFGPDLDRPDHVLWVLGSYGDEDLVASHLGIDRDRIVAGRRALMAPHRGVDLLTQVSILSLLGEGAVTMGIWSRLAAARGVELVHPFPAPAVVDAAARVPWPAKLAEPKRLVRALLRRHDVPEAIVARPKRSFGLPDGHWAPPGALFQPLVDLMAGDLPAERLRALQGTDPGRTNVLWSYVNLWLWRRLVIEGAPAADLAEEVVARHRHQEARRP